MTHFFRFPSSLTLSRVFQDGDSIVFNLSMLTSDVYAVLFTLLFHGYLVSWLYFLAFALVLVGLVLYYSETPPLRVGLAGSIAGGAAAPASAAQTQRARPRSAGSRPRPGSPGRLGEDGRQGSQTGLGQSLKAVAGYAAPAYNPLTTRNPDDDADADAPMRR